MPPGWSADRSAGPVGGVVDLVDPDDVHLDPGLAEFEVEPARQLTSMLPRHCEAGAQLCSTSRSIVKVSGGSNVRTPTSPDRRSLPWRVGRLATAQPSSLVRSGRPMLDGRATVSARPLGSAASDLAAARRQEVGSPADGEDDRDRRDRPSGIDVHQGSPSRHPERVSPLSGGSGGHRDRPPRGLGEASRPLLEPRGEDRVGIALDGHASRASVGSTWLSATIAARRVRVA